MPAFTISVPDNPSTNAYSIDILEFAENTEMSQIGQDQARVVARLKVPWLFREQAKKALLGFTCRNVMNGVPYIQRILPLQHPDIPYLYARTIMSCTGVGALGTKGGGGNQGVTGTAQFQFAEIQVAFESYRCAILDDNSVMGLVPASFTVAILTSLAPDITGPPEGGNFALTFSIDGGAAVTLPNIQYNITGSSLQFLLTTISVSATVSGPAGGPWSFNFPLSAGVVTITGNGAGLNGALAPFNVPVTIISPGGIQVPTEANFQRFCVRNWRVSQQVHHTETGSWRWQDGPNGPPADMGRGRPVTQKLPMRMSRFMMSMTILNLPISLINIKAIGQCLNCTNATQFDPYGWNCDPGTVLFQEPILATQRPLADGQLGTDLSMLYLFNPTGWNAWPDPNDFNRFHTVGGSGNARQFPQVDFAASLRPPN